MFIGDRQHSARARGRVVDGADHAGLGQHVVVLDEQQVDHQADDFARREVLTGRLVGQFRELADQLLEREPHLVVVDRLGMQVDARELLGDLIEQPALGQLVDLGREAEPLEDVAHGGRERLNIGEEVLADVVLIAHQLAHVHGRGVVEALAGGAQQERVGVQLRFLFGGELRKHLGLGWLQDAVQTTQHREGQDDLAVVGLLVVAPQKIGDGPDERRQCLMVHGEWPFS